jgi:hypothetical protein
LLPAEVFDPVTRALIATRPPEYAPPGEPTLKSY